jgi:hypothetical protein
LDVEEIDTMSNKLTNSFSQMKAEEQGRAKKGAVGTKFAKPGVGI